MPEMTDAEFLDFYRDFYSVWDLSDDELIGRRREIAAAANHGWDQEKYDAWWQDPNRRPNLVSKRDIAEMLGISLVTVDNWVRQGAPVYRKGDHGVAYQIDTAEFMDWYTAREWGMSIAQYREQSLEEAIKSRENEEARWRLLEAEARNRKLAATTEALTTELAALRREVSALKRGRKAK